MFEDVLLTQRINLRKGRIMKAVILDGSHANDATGARVRAALMGKMQGQDWELEYIPLHAKKIGNCAGDFFCWIRNPGVCNIDDDNREIAAAIANSDLMVYLTPITFGGYSSVLKKAVDHQIQNISPFFAQVDGETHHQKRYKEYPDFLAVGWSEERDEKAETVFRHLAWRNSLNFYARSMVTVVVSASQTDSEIQEAAQAWLNDIREGAKPVGLKLPETVVTASGKRKVRRALLLVGSPRTRKSTSNSLGTYLFERLNALDIRTETIYLHTVLRSPEKMKALLAAVDAADLVLLAFPLYVDSLPAPVIAALERIAAQREDHTASQLFAAIANCGFPEMEHNTTALAICETFARQARFQWAGSLALGAGEGMVHGMPLTELDGRAIPLKRALNLAAEALASGAAIPAAAQDLLAKPFIPAWMYHFMGRFGWQQQAKGYGAQRKLMNKPYAGTNSRERV
jgi:multimeric flavodoxin WrbA